MSGENVELERFDLNVLDGDIFDTTVWILNTATFHWATVRGAS